MEYMLLIYVNPESYAGLSEAEQQAIFGEYMDYTAKMRGAGAFVYGDALQGADTATVVRGREASAPSPTAPSSRPRRCSSATTR